MSCFPFCRFSQHIVSKQTFFVSRAALIRRHRTCYFRKHVTSAHAELGAEIHNVSRNRARTKVLPQAQKLHVYGNGTFGAFGNFKIPSTWRWGCVHKQLWATGFIARRHLRPISLLTLWISGGLTQT